MSINKDYKKNAILDAIRNSCDDEYWYYIKASEIRDYAKEVWDVEIAEMYIKHLIHEIRVEGSAELPIISSRHGFSFTTDRDEVAKFVETCKRRIKQVKAVKDAMIYELTRME